MTFNSIIITYAKHTSASTSMAFITISLMASNDFFSCFQSKSRALAGRFLNCLSIVHLEWWNIRRYSRDLQLKNSEVWRMKSSLRGHHASWKLQIQVCLRIFPWKISMRDLLKHSICPSGWRCGGVVRVFSMSISVQTSTNTFDSKLVPWWLWSWQGTPK